MPAQTLPVAFRHPLRVYWEDTDAGGVVFHANYLKFFERARTEWLRTLGVGQQRLLDITVAVAEAGRASLRLQQQAWRGGELLAEGTIRIGCVTSAGFRPCRIPAAILEKIQ